MELGNRRGLLEGRRHKGRWTAEREEVPAVSKALERPGAAAGPCCPTSCAAPAGPGR